MHPRRGELEAEAPIRIRTLHKREGARVYLCGTLGAEFDQWQRKLSAVSAADAYFAQQIGLDAIERAMDEMEDRVRSEVEAEGHRLLPRRSPGYGSLPLSLSREILERLDAPRRIGVSLTDALLLVPSKSVTAICEIIQSNIEVGQRVREKGLCDD